MSYLYLDTSFEQFVGLTDDQFKFVDWYKTEENKSSQFLHSQVDKILLKNKLSAKKLKGLFYCAGPGSYTGMRQVLSFAQVLSAESVPVFPFYHFEIPRMLGISNGVFASNAFKGETFIYSWDEFVTKKKLVKTSEKDLELSTFVGNKFSVNNEYRSTAEMIFDNSSKVFALLFQEKSQKDLYYYRDLEVEFKVSIGES